MTESVAVKLDPQKAAEEAKARNLQAPQAAFGRLATLPDEQGNQYGSMTTEETDRDFDEFIEIASHAEASVLEIGAAYGTTYLVEAFKQDVPARYTAVDILPDQLKILVRRIEELYPSDPDKLSRLTLIGGGFPAKEVVNELQEGGYDAILATNVFHFLTEEETVEAFHQVHRLLKPGGKLFLKIATPYINLIDPDHQEKMAKDIKNFLNCADQRKRPFPGFVENMRSVLNKSVEEKTVDDIGITLKHMFFCDKEIAKIILESEGFKIEKCDYGACPSYPWKCDGREYVIAIAQRKTDD